MGKFRLASESAVYGVEHPNHLIDGRIQRCGADFAGRTLIQVFFQDPADGLRLGLHLIGPGSVRVEDAGEHRPEAGPPILAIRWEVRTAEEDLSFRVEKRRQRPAALLGQCLDGALVTCVYIRTLVAIHLDADKMLVQETGQLGVLVGLAVHDMAPMTPDGADVEQHRFVGRLRRGECLGTPGVPMDRLMGRRLEIGRS